MFGYEDELRDEIETIKSNGIPKDKIQEVLLGYLEDEFWVNCWAMGDSEASVLFTELINISYKLEIVLPENIIKRFGGNSVKSK